MSTFKKFEDIESWKKARDLDKKLFTMIENSRLSKDYALRIKCLGLQDQ